MALVTPSQAAASLLPSPSSTNMPLNLVEGVGARSGAPSPPLVLEQEVSDSSLTMLGERWEGGLERMDGGVNWGATLVRLGVLTLRVYLVSSR